MIRFVKYLAVTAAILGALFFGFLLVAQLTYAGFFDKEYSQEELTEHFYEHEPAFQVIFDVTKQVPPAAHGLSVFFEKSDNGKVNLTGYSGNVYNGQKEQWGGDNLPSNAPQLVAILIKLNWEHHDIERLNKALQETNCAYIHLHQGRVKVLYERSGRATAWYRFYPNPIMANDEKVYGAPIGNQGLSQHVVIDIAYGDATTL